MIFPSYSHIILYISPWAETLHELMKPENRMFLDELHDEADGLVIPRNQVEDWTNDEKDETWLGWILSVRMNQLWTNYDDEKDEPIMMMKRMKHAETLSNESI